MKIVKEENNKPMTFKQLVKGFSQIKTRFDFDLMCAEIDNAFQHEKISWDDHQMLYSLASVISKGLK